MSERDPTPWLTAARAGSHEALGQGLERYRRYLLQIAQHGLDPDLRAKGGASDLGGVGPEEWVGLGRATDPGRREALRALVHTTEGSLQALERAVGAALATVQKVGRALAARG